MYYKLLFVLKSRIYRFFSLIKIFSLNLKGASIHKSNRLHHTCLFVWPHKVKLGKGNNIEHQVYFKFDGPYSKGRGIIVGEFGFIGSNTEFNIKGKIEIGDHCLIASGSRFIDHDHGIKMGELMSKQPCPTFPIVIEDDVWIGCNVVVLKNVRIGKGAIVAAGALVNRSIPEYEIWGGIPAKKIGTRRKNSSVETSLQKNV